MFKGLAISIFCLSSCLALSSATAAEKIANPVAVKAIQALLKVDTAAAEISKMFSCSSTVCEVLVPTQVGHQQVNQVGKEYSLKYLLIENQEAKKLYQIISSSVSNYEGDLNYGDETQHSNGTITESVWSIASDLGLYTMTVSSYSDLGGGGHSGGYVHRTWNAGTIGDDSIRCDSWSDKVFAECKIFVQSAP